jgi:microsomal epoxide hydrolase
MKAIHIIAVGALAIVLSYLYIYYGGSQEPMKFPTDGYFGPGKKTADDTSIKPFKINVPDEVLKDLKERIKRTRIGHKQLEDVQDFTYGMNLKTVMDFKNYWETKYDWRKAEAQLNYFPQYTTQIEGLKIHFIHAKPPANKYQRIVPLLLVHGWPGNIYEFYKIIPYLSDPNNHFDGAESDIAFEVIAPSIPGYGFSEASQKSGFDQIATARIFKKLMNERLGFKRFMVQGGDWGSLVVTNLGRMYPEYLYGVHINMAFVMNAKANFLSILGSFFPTLMFKDKEFYDFSMKKMFLEIIKESGYMHIQATKPDTVGIGLNDSPIGLMTYILEKFSTWTNPNFRNLADGGLEKKFTKDELLTIVTIYWINGNILPSQRYYREYFANLEAQEFAKQYLRVPTALASFPHDLGIRLPREIVETAMNITHFTLMKDGGHFAAFEMPKQLATDIIAFTTETVRIV